MYYEQATWTQNAHIGHSIPGQEEFGPIALWEIELQEIQARI